MIIRPSIEALRKRDEGRLWAAREKARDRVIYRRICIALWLVVFPLTSIGFTWLLNRLIPWLERALS